MHLYTRRTRRTLTPTRRNPYPCWRVRVCLGKGTGSPGIPQGYPLQSLRFTKQFHILVKGLPASIPEALETDKLAIFGSDPKAFDNPATSADELWEMGLNNLLKSALGWGLEEDMDLII